MPSVKCRPSCRPKTRVLIDLWYQKCWNHITNSVENGTAWSITGIELSAPTIQRSKITNIVPKTLRTIQKSVQLNNMSSRKQITKRMVAPRYQFFKHEWITHKDYHNCSQNQNPPHTTADLKHKSSCSYLESVSPPYINSQFIVCN